MGGGIAARNKNATQGTFHMNPDYALWYGWSEMKRDLSEIKAMARQPRKGAARSPASRASRRADRARCPPGDRWEADGLDRERRSQEKLTGCHPGTPSARVPRRARLGTRPVRGIRAHLIPEPRQFSFCSVLTGCLVLESSRLATRYSQLSGLHGGTGFAMRSRSARRFRAGHRAHTVGG